MRPANLGVFLWVVGCSLLGACETPLMAAEHHPLKKPWTDTALESAWKSAISEAAKHGSAESGASTVKDINVEFDKKVGAVVFHWIDEKGGDVRFSVPARGELDVEVAATVSRDKSFETATFQYVFTVATLAGSKRALWTLDVVTDAVIVSGHGADAAWRFYTVKGGSPGFRARLSGWTWVTDSPVRQAGSAVRRGFVVVSSDLPGLVQISATGDLPDEESRLQDSREDADSLPDAVFLTWESLAERLGPAKGFTLGPVRFPANPTERFGKVSEQLVEMMKLDWIESGDAADQLKNAVQALAKSAASGDGQIVTDQKNKVERLVTSLVERGQALPEVRDFLLVHLAALHSEDTVKK